MALNLKYTTALRNAKMDAITTAAGASALLRIYDGTQAANANTAVGAQVLLAELVCNATFAPAASGGVLTLNAVSNDAAANATGTASWFRLVKSDGTTVIMDGSVGTTGADLNLNSVSITTGQVVSVSSFALTSGNA